jgi:hypothetical protein
MCWSQPARVDHLHKKWKAGRKNISRKMGTASQAQVLIHGRRATAGCRPALGHRPLVAGVPRLWDSSNFFEIFLFKKKEFLVVWVMGQGF